jgi:DUF1016 N-terminal domain
MLSNYRSKFKLKIQNTENQLFIDIENLIAESRKAIALSVNAELTLRNWLIGKSINEFILQHQRAEYGKQVIVQLSEKLIPKYGKMWDKKMLWACSKFQEVFAEEKIVDAVRRQLSWTHLRTLIYIENPLKRDFYIEMCKLEHWITRTLQVGFSEVLLFSLKKSL